MSKDPFRQTDDRAREIARALLSNMRHAVLGTLDPDTGTPLLTRIAVQLDEDGTPLALLSGLASHTRALTADDRAGLMVAAVDPGKGDVMTHARLSILARARLTPTDARKRARWLEQDPKARVYIDLPDFHFWRIEPVSGLLNAGFAQAFRLLPSDMLTPPTS